MKSLSSINAICTAENAMHAFRMMKTLEVEEVWVMALSPRLERIHLRPLFRGSQQLCLFEPREIFRYALQCNAAGLIVAHNHPEGPALPSQTDLRSTRRLVAAGRILGVVIHDHILITPKQGDLSLRHSYPLLFSEATHRRQEVS